MLTYQAVSFLFLLHSCVHPWHCHQTLRQVPLHLGVGLGIFQWPFPLMITPCSTHRTVLCNEYLEGAPARTHNMGFCIMITYVFTLQISHLSLEVLQHVWVLYFLMHEDLTNCTFYALTTMWQFWYNLGIFDLIRFKALSNNTYPTIPVFYNEKKKES